MAKIQQCLIDIELANSLHVLARALGVKTPGGELGFLCPSCERPVRPHGGASPHFEHTERNPDCPLSHKLPPQSKAPPVADGSDEGKPVE